MWSHRRLDKEKENWSVTVWYQNCKGRPPLTTVVILCWLLVCFRPLPSLRRTPLSHFGRVRWEMVDAIYPKWRYNRIPVGVSAYEEKQWRHWPFIQGGDQTWIYSIEYSDQMFKNWFQYSEFEFVHDIYNKDGEHVKIKRWKPFSKCVLVQTASAQGKDGYKVSASPM